MAGCPAADDPSGGACQVRTTGQGFPAHCSAQLAAAHKNILFLGNSYTTTNNLPGVLSSLAAAAGGAVGRGFGDGSVALWNGSVTLSKPLAPRHPLAPGHPSIP